MVSSSQQAIVCILLLLSIAVCAKSQSVPDKSASSSISGKITAKGKGVSGVVVGLIHKENWQHDSTRLRAVTDDEGNYRITNVPAGNYDVVVSAPVYVTATVYKSLILGKNETVENVDIAVVRGGVITGRVVDADGNPVIEEEISISPPSRVNARVTIRPTRTDDRGVFRVFGVPPGRYVVSAGRGESSSFGSPYDRIGYRLTYHPAATEVSAATVIEVTEGSEATNVDITLERPLVRYSARGRTVDADTGQPLPNIPYGIVRFVDAKMSSVITAGSASNNNGEFTLQNLPPGKYEVFTDVPPDGNWRPEFLGFEVIDQDVEGLVVKISKGSTVSGLVVAEGIADKTIQSSITQGHVHADNASRRPGVRSPQANIKPDGSFQIGGLTAGLTTFSADLPNRIQLVRVERDGVALGGGVEIKDGEHITGLRLIVSHANATIRGVVKLASGTLPPNERLYVSARRITDESSASRLFDATQVDTRGQFVIEGLLPGTYELSAGIDTPSEGKRVQRITQQVVVNSAAVTNVTITVP